MVSMNKHFLGWRIHYPGPRCLERCEIMEAGVRSNYEIISWLLSTFFLHVTCFNVTLLNVILFRKTMLYYRVMAVCIC